MTRLVSSTVVAKALGIDSNSVRRAVRMGQLMPAVRTPGGQLRFDPAEIERFKFRAIELPENRTTTDLNPAPLPAAASYVEARDWIMDDIVSTGGANIWRPARKKRQIWDAGLVKPFSDTPKLLNDNIIEQLLGFGRRELHQRLVSSSLQEVAQSLNVRPVVLQRFCDAYRIPIPANPSGTKSRGK